eukprot:scaffold32323_cov107-Isochrysis_galbana.AAC.2
MPAMRRCATSTSPSRKPCSRACSSGCSGRRRRAKYMTGSCRVRHCEHRSSCGRFHAPCSRTVVLLFWMLTTWAELPSTCVATKARCTGASGLTAGPSVRSSASAVTVSGRGAGHRTAQSCGLSRWTPTTYSRGRCCGQPCSDGCSVRACTS